MTMKSAKKDAASRPDDSPQDQIDLTAADWIARRNGGGLTASEQSRLAAWLQADPLHAEVFAEMEAVWSTLNEPRKLGRADVVAVDLDRRALSRTRRRFAWSAAGLAAAAAITLAFLPLQPTSPQRHADARTIMVRPDLRTLPDGSMVELNFGAEIAVAYSERRRSVQLLKGEALFDILRDPTRPFIVSAGAVSVRAVGTTFAVRHDPEQVNVLVTEGKVAVERVDEVPSAENASSAIPEAVYLDVGRQATIPTMHSETTPLQIRQVSPAELAAALAWREKRVEFSDTPFPEAVQLFNRHNRVQFVLADDSLAQRRITGVFWSDDPEGFVRLVEPGFNVKAERDGNVITLGTR